MCLPANLHVQIWDIADMLLDLDICQCIWDTHFWKDVSLHFLWCDYQGASNVHLSLILGYLLLWCVFRFCFKKFSSSVSCNCSNEQQVADELFWSMKCALFWFFLFSFFCSWHYHILFLRMFSLSVIPFQLLHIKCDNDEHMFQRSSAFFWCNSEDSPPCLDISSITLTPRSSPDSRLLPGLLIPPPSKSGLPKPTNEYSCPRPRVILLCKSFLIFFAFLCSLLCVNLY